METIASIFSSLDKKTPVALVLLVLFIMLTVLNVKMNDMAKDISRIEIKLGNHITDTNRKIEKLSDRFDRLYETLIKDKK